MTPRLAYTLAACCLAILPALAQAPGLANINTQLRAQETQDSQLMWWLHEVTDVYGPRLTGSPGLRAAQDFAVGQMEKWGFSNVHLEASSFVLPDLDRHRRFLPGDVVRFSQSHSSSSERRMRTRRPRRVTPGSWPRSMRA